MEHNRFFQNIKCEYFPCHKGIPETEFNCLFCYCPLYALGSECGGNYCYTENGIKDCSYCIRPHLRENYDDILSEMPRVLELAKKRGNPVEKP